MGNGAGGYTRLEFSIPSRGLIGYRGEFMTDTKGNGIINTIFDDYGPYKGDIMYRKQGSLIAFEAGEAVTYGLYNAQDGLIAERTTDENGHILFQTKHSEGIVMMAHNLYYIQEIAAPTGYMLDDTKHWFVFCNSSSNTCDECNRVIGNTDAKRIPFEQIGRVDAVNVLAGFELPATGGSGNIFNTLCGLILISAPLVYGLSLRRKYERRLRE